MSEIKTHIKSDGRLDLSEEVLNKLKNTDIKIVTDKNIDEKEFKTYDFWELLNDGPKAEGYKDVITREMIHKKE